MRYLVATQHSCALTRQSSHLRAAFRGFRCPGKLARTTRAHGKVWLRGLDSNQDSQLQRLVSYQLDDPGIADSSALSLARAATEVIVPALRSFAPHPVSVRESPLSARLSKYRPGEVSERFKEHAWKACVGEILPWVQIPPSPPSSYTCEIVKQVCIPSGLDNVGLIMRLLQSD